MESNKKRDKTREVDTCRVFAEGMELSGWGCTAYHSC
jgi:hypothetical protein